MTLLRIALVVHGRFYIFDLARELIRMGHDVVLFTNYPKRVCERFGIPRAQVVNNVVHGVTSRGLMKMFPGGLGGRVERLNNTKFGLWAARAVTDRGPWDVVASMSGVAEDLFIELKGAHTLCVLERASTHIREQKRILAEEERAGGGCVEQPSDWIIAREEREYELADLVHVLSPSLQQPFIDAGLPLTKLSVLLLGVEINKFMSSAEVIEERCQRIMSGEPLRIICTGTFSRRKGSRIWAELFKTPPGPAALIRFVGSILPDAAAHVTALRPHVQFVSKVPQAELPDHYRWADLFVLPTLEDGFPVVIGQALASGLPVITTTSCGASSIVENGVTGWVIPPASADVLAERINWANTHRAELTAAVRRVSNSDVSRDWKAVAESFLNSVVSRLPVRTGSAAMRDD